MARTDEREFRLRPRRPTRSRKGKAPVAWATAYVAVMNQAKISRKRGASQPGRTTKTYSQRCSVRVTYSNRRIKGHWRAHGRYITRDSAAEPGAPPESGFDQSATGINIPEKLNQWQTSGDERLWRFIVSPEFGERLDLTRLTRELMDRVERDINRPLEWVAIAHFNTEHPHIHIAVRGRDRNGNEVRFEREYIRNGLRAIAEDLCTRQLGFRTTVDAEYARARETEQQHPTSLDRMITRQADSPFEEDPHRFVFTLPEIEKEGQRSTVQALAVRANVLVRMGLAEPVDARRWSVRRDFEAVLRAMKRGRDRQKTLAAHGVPLSDDRLPFVTVDFRRLKQIEGRVVVHGEDDIGPGAGRLYLLIEGADAVHHVPYTPEIQDARHRGLLRVNSFVRLRRVFQEARPILQIEDLGEAERLHSKPRVVREAPARGR
jgi:type IV secretory pathway VirD2 relaxase